MAPVRPCDYGPGKPAKAKSEIVKASEEVVGEHASLLEDAAEIVSRRLNNLLITNPGKWPAPHRAFSSKSCGFSARSDHEVVHDELPCPFNEFRVNGSKMRFCYGDVQVWLLDRLQLGVEDLLGLTPISSVSGLLPAAQGVLDKINTAGPPEKVEPLFHNLVYDKQDET
jgi:hypothetical protein